MALTYSPLAYELFIGIDVDKKSYAFTIRDHATMIRSKKIPAQPEQLCNYIEKNYQGRRVLCGYEAGPTGFQLHDYLSMKDIPCYVVAPLSMPKAPNEKVKNNRLDSERIAQHLKSGEAHPIRIPEGPYRELRHLVKLRENYSRARMQAKQRIKGLLLSTGLVLQEPDTRWSRRSITKLKAIESTPAVCKRLAMLIRDLEYAREQTLDVHRSLRSFVKQHLEIEKNMVYLRSIPGIGFITAVSVLGKIGDPQYLRNVRELGAFVGVTPTEHSSGDTISHGHITHSGDQTLRFLLVEAAWVAIRHDTELYQFYHRIKSRHHPKIGAKKAITAVARKLTQRIYRVLKDQRVYRTH